VKKIAKRLRRSCEVYFLLSDSSSNLCFKKLLLFFFIYLLLHLKLVLFDLTPDRLIKQKVKVVKG